MNQAIQKTTEAKRDIRSFISSDTVRAQMAMVLPKHITADRMARVAVTAIMRVPKLLQCTQDSLLNCLMQCSQMGLEPDGRRAHLIPFENKKKGVTECTLIVDWKGLAELAMRGGTIAKLHADLICEHDEFSFDMGEILHHKIDFRKDRGAPYAAYSMATTKTGEKFVQVMTRSEIEAIRDNSQGWRAFKAGYTFSSPWQDAPGEMWKKTVFRRLSKWLVLSPEFRDAQEIDETTDVDTTLNTERQKPIMPEFELPPQIDDAKSETVEINASAKTEPVKQPEAPKTINYVKGLRGLLKLAAISEAEFLDYMRQFHAWDDSLSSLEEVLMTSPSALQHAYENWTELLKAMQSELAKFKK